MSDGASLFAVMPSNRTMGNRSKLEHGKIHTNLRKNFLTLRVTEHFNKLIREIVDLLEIFKTHLDAFPDVLMLNWIISRDPFQSLLFCDSVEFLLIFSAFKHHKRNPNLKYIKLTTWIWLNLRNMKVRFNKTILVFVLIFLHCLVCKISLSHRA